MLDESETAFLVGGPFNSEIRQIAADPPRAIRLPVIAKPCLDAEPDEAPRSADYYLRNGTMNLPYRLDTGELVYEFKGYTEARYPIEK